MARKKLRNCSRCGVRHGPPIGTRCKRAEDEFRKLNEEMGETPEAVIKDDAVKTVKETANVEAVHEPAVAGLVEGQEERKQDGTQEVLPDYVLPSFSEYLQRRGAERNASRAPDDLNVTDSQERCQEASEQNGQPGFYYQVPWQFVPPELRGRHHYPPMFRGDPPTSFEPRQAPEPQQQTSAPTVRTEPPSDSKAPNLENVMELMLNSQREQMKIQTEILQSLRPPATLPAQPQPPAPAAAANVDSSSSDSEGETEEWKAGFGDELWRNVKGKRSKNPFEQGTYLTKSEPIDSFERIMMITFKTLKQLLEANGEVKGVVRHGLALAEKASKDVYQVTAFTKYDESVRERAGQVGPNAFGTVDQEDTLRFFSYDNVIRSKPGKSAASSNREHKKKSDKMCLKYNDQGCNAKSCPYAHICAACEEHGHTRRECKNLKKKDK